MRLTSDGLTKTLCEGSLHAFMRKAWHTVEPSAFEDNWHLRAICEHLEAVTYGEIQNLAICEPPRHCKSTTVSVMWPAWEWGPARKPGTRFMFASYASGLSKQDSIRCKKVITSPFYRRHWGENVQLVRSQESFFDNSAGGQRYATSVDGTITGWGADRIVIDDPHNLKDVHSDAARRKVVQWHEEVLTSRSDNPRTGSRVLIMQRSHANDLIGYIMERFGKDYVCLILDEEFEPSTRCRTSIGFVDPRIEPGELLWPSRFGPVEVERIKKSAGRFAYSAQYQQRPSLPEGSIFKTAWWQRYDRPASMVALEMEELWQSWDLTFKDTKESDFVVGQVWGKRGADRYLLDSVRGRMSYTATLAAIRRLTDKWPLAKRKLIERAANAEAVIDNMKHEIVGLIGVPPSGSKAARAYAVTPECESGNVYIPTPANAPWIDDWIEEMAAFDKGAHDDQVDATSQALQFAQKLASLTVAPIRSGTRPSAWGERTG